jgi:hypothetical protein
MPKARAEELLSDIVRLGGRSLATNLLHGVRTGFQNIESAKRSKGRARGGGQSSKAKGRAGVVQVRDFLLGALPGLSPGDIWVKATSQLGADLHLSPAAMRKFPAHIEVKFQESLNIWGALAQAEEGAKREKLGRFPIVFFKRSRSRLYMAMAADEFIGRFVIDVTQGRTEDTPAVGPEGV